MARTYDPKTGTWKKTSSNDTTDTTKKDDNLTSTTSDTDSSTGSVEQKYNYIEINTLVGTLNFIVTKETIKVKAGDTLNLKGLGKHLSGKYYVKDITRQISNNGYSHTATLIKTDFGESLKTKTSTKSKKSTKKSSKKVSSANKSSSAKRTHTVKTGECLWGIAVKYYGDGSKYTKIYDANTNKIANPNLIYPGQVFVIP